MRLRAFALLVLAAAFPSRALARGDALADRIDALVRGLKLRDPEVGVAVLRARDGAPVYRHRADASLRLASNTKLLTPAAALCLLGPDFRFRTPLAVDGEDLRVFAGGDPNISGRFHDGDPAAVFRAWARALLDADVDRVRDVVLHVGIFDDVRKHPAWKVHDRWWWWTAPFGPLSLNDNCVDLTVSPAEPGAPARVSLSPDTGFVTIVNRTESRKNASKPFGFTRPAGSNRVTLRGHVAGPATYPVAVHDPEGFFGAVLVETLERAGVAVEGEIRRTDAPREDFPSAVPRAVYESGLPETLAVCNRRSQNFYAEMLLRVVGWKIRGKGSTENGLGAVRAVLEDEVGLDSMAQADGCGLSRDNFASAGDLARLLLYMRRHPAAAVFTASLAENGGSEGTLRKRMRDDDVRGRVRAKTGHIRGVSTLSGYAENLGGETYVFSILVNARGWTGDADRMQNEIAELLVRWKD